jgi:hypothetical protein
VLSCEWPPQPERAELERIALEHRATHMGFAPDAFLVGRSARCRHARKRVGAPECPGVLARLISILEESRAYVVHAQNLDLEEWNTPIAHYCPSGVNAWRNALEREFRPPFWARLEIDSTGTPHAHMVADAAATMLDLRGQPIRTAFGLAGYLAKPRDARATLEAEGLYLWAKSQARASGTRLASTVFQRGIPRSRPYLYTCSQSSQP